MKMAANSSETDSDGILPLHTEKEKEEEIQAYIYTLDFTEASYLWRIPPPNFFFFVFCLFIVLLHKNTAKKEMYSTIKGKYS